MPKKPARISTGPMEDLLSANVGGARSTLQVAIKRYSSAHLKHLGALEESSAKEAQEKRLMLEYKSTRTVNNSLAELLEPSELEELKKLKDETNTALQVASRSWEQHRLAKSTLISAEAESEHAARHLALKLQKLVDAKERLINEISKNSTAG